MKKMMFVNISNHPSATWDEKQIQAAKYLVACNPLYVPDVEIRDIPFPAIPPEADTEQVKHICSMLPLPGRNEPIESRPDAIMMVQGEHVATVYIVAYVQQALGYSAVAATTERIAEERDGIKSSRFRFVRFRFYPELGEILYADAFERQERPKTIRPRPIEDGTIGSQSNY